MIGTTELLDHAAILHRALGTVDPPFIKEFSVKSEGGALRDGRCLISFPRAALGPGPKQKLRDICATLGAPERAFARLEPVQGMARQVHFGLDLRGSDSIRKCYLEFAPNAAPEPRLVFLAIKWTESGKVGVSLYQSLDPLTSAAVNALVDRAEIDPVAGSVFQAFVAEGKVPVLEVVDETSSRRSFDLNLAGYGWRLRDKHDPLLRLLGGTTEADRYLRRHQDEWLGHIAAGIGDKGQAFATLYHGAHRLEVLA